MGENRTGFTQECDLTLFFWPVEWFEGWICCQERWEPLRTRGISVFTLSDGIGVYSPTPAHSLVLLEENVWGICGFF